MKAEEMWKAFGAEGDYEAWSFGGEPNLLAQLVKDGIKTATCSAKIWYEIEDEELPAAGNYSVILDADDNAVCIIRCSKVYTAKFSEVSPEHACKEGEGDRSLAYWREAHRKFFTEELREINLPFDKDMLLVCEEFECLYPR